MFSFYKDFVKLFFLILVDKNLMSMLPTKTQTNLINLHLYYYIQTYLITWYCFMELLLHEQRAEHVPWVLNLNYIKLFQTVLLEDNMF